MNDAASSLAALRALVEGDVPPGRSDEFIEQLCYHRLAPLAVDLWRDSAAHRPFSDALRREVAGRAAVDMRQFSALRAVLEILHERQIDVLVVKGAALGALLYTSTAHRPRADVDLWFRGWGDVERAGRALEELGYSAVHALPGRLVPHAQSYRLASGRRGAEFDLHARISRRHRVSAALDFARAWESRRQAVANGCRFATLAPPWAWLHSALHLSTHHAGQSAPAIMFEDLRRLSQMLSGEEWADIWDRIVAAELVSAVRSSAEQLKIWAPDAMDRNFSRALDAAGDDASAAHDSDIAAVLDDLLVIDEPGHYLRELLAPPDDYLLRHYGVARPRRAALLRALRLVDGGWSWARRDLHA